MTRHSDRSPPAHQRPSDSLAAPAEAGQGVGTLSQYDLDEIDALKVLRKMRQSVGIGSEAYGALLTATAILAVRLKDRGIQA
jgi:hypothetical protein